MRLSVLHRKLGRDLWRIRAQGAAIAVVVAIGVMVLVMMSGLIATLSGTRESYFERYRFATVFAHATRAPQSLLARLAAIDGVMAAEGRITGLARIALPDEALPVAAQVVSLPAATATRLNDVALTQGRMPAPGQSREVLLLDSFARARGIAPGDTLSVTLGGGRQRFRVTGLALSPEFIFSAPPGALMPDDRRFAVIWMARGAAAAAYDMDGAFNDLLLLTSRARPEAAIIDEVDRLLAPFGGQQAYGRDQQISAKFVGEEIRGLRAMSALLPPIFLAVAAFLLNVVIGRIVQAERREIGLLKAFGHRGAEIAAHYLEMVLIIALAGAALGAALGVLAGRALIPTYAGVYKFPYLVYDIRPGPFAAGVLASLGAAALGAALVLRAVMRLTPAEAMRPPAPPDFSRQGGGLLARVLDQPGRMILRQLTRQPLRSLGAVIGIVAGLGLSAAMMSLYDSFDQAVEMSFAVEDRSDATVTLTQPLGAALRNDIASLPGVILAEPTRQVPVVFRNGRHHRNSALTGLPAGARLTRAVDATGRVIVLRGGGLVLSKALAGSLQIAPGDMLRVEVAEGHRPVLTLPVTGIADSQLGAPAYIEARALARHLGQAPRATALALRIDPAQKDALFARLSLMPAVAGVVLKSDLIAAIRQVMDQGMGQMRVIFGVIAFALSFGIVYNAARIAFAERAHELATLRVLGFTRAEVTLLLFGEIAVMVVLAIPFGAALAHALARGLGASFSNDMYQVAVRLSPQSFGFAVLVTLAALAVSLLLVRRSLDRMDMVAALKSRE